MKKLGIFLLFVSLVACKNVEQYKAGIEELGSKWEATTASFTGFASTVETENKAFASMNDSLMVDSMALAKLAPDAQTKLNDAKAAFTNAGAGYASLLTDISGFTTEWAAKGAEVTALKDGLAAGKLEGDVAAKIAELTNYVTESEGKLGTLTETLKNVKEGVTNSFVNYKNLIAQYLPKK